MHCTPRATTQCALVTDRQVGLRRAGSLTLGRCTFALHVLSDANAGSHIRTVFCYILSLVRSDSTGSFLLT